MNGRGKSVPPAARDSTRLKDHLRSLAASPPVVGLGVSEHGSEVPPSGWINPFGTPSYGVPAAISRRSRARACFQSRLTVAWEQPNTSALSSIVRPEKTRSSGPFVALAFDI